MTGVTTGRAACSTPTRRAIVLYDATVGRDVDLDGLSLLMKGEELGDGSRWRGIPARGVAEPATVELPVTAGTRS